ncbi:hypothetical protein D3C80_1281730 [compost metagenome]
MVEVGLAQVGGGGHYLGVRGNHGVVDQRAAGAELLTCAVDSGLGDTQVIAGVGQLFCSNRPAIGQHLAPVEVLLGFAQFGLAGFQLGLERVDIAVQPAHLTHAACQLGFGRLQGHLAVGRVELQQHLAGMDQVAVIGTNAGDGTGHQRGDLYHVAVDVGVIGALVPTPDQGVPGPGADAANNQQQQQAEQPGLAFARRLGCVGGGCGVCGSGHDNTLDNA